MSSTNLALYFGTPQLAARTRVRDVWPAHTSVPHVLVLHDGLQVALVPEPMFRAWLEDDPDAPAPRVVAVGPLPMGM